MSQFSNISDNHVLIDDRVNYEVVVGNIADSKEDSIVNSTGRKINLGVSVAKALATKAGEAELSKACKKLTPLQEGGVVSTSGYKLHCKQILHCNCPNWNAKTKDNKELKAIICKCLEKAAIEGHQSVAMPAIGMGIKGYPSTVVGHSMIEVILEYCKANPNTSLTHVKLYLYTADVTDTVHQAFSDPLLLIGYEKKADGFALGNGVRFEVFKGDLTETKADIIVNSTGNAMSLSCGNVAPALFKKAGQDMQDECSRHGSLGEGEIFMTDGFLLPCANVLHVNTPSWSAGRTEKELEQIITTCLEWTNNSRARSIAFPAMGTGVLGYPPSSVAKCFFQASANYANEHPTSNLKRIMLVAYTHNEPVIKGFESMLNIQISTKARVDRTENTMEEEEGKVVIDLPSLWEKPVHVYKEFEVARRTTEWKDVETSFKLTIGRPADQVDLREITRIQHPRNYLFYQSMRSDVAKRLGKQEDEVETASLWHATKPENIKKITNNMFDRGLSGAVDDDSLGAGSSFATTFKYSDGKNPHTNAAGEKFMIMVRVVTGEYCKGDGTLKHAPYKPGSEVEQYDSVVDDMSNPTMYAVFHDASACPDYVIKYKFIQSSSSSSRPAPSGLVKARAPNRPVSAPTAAKPFSQASRASTARATSSHRSRDDDSSCSIL